jgi:hydrogenase maturation protease
VSVLVAGIGNVFLEDDGFGVEVARRLAAEPLPDGVRAVDFGIRGTHLAFELLDGPDLLIVADAATRGEAPGTVLLLEPDLDALAPSDGDAHAMDLGAVLASVRAMGGTLPRVLVVGCEPASLGERMGLTPSVRDAVAPAVELIRDLLRRHGGPP